MQVQPAQTDDLHNRSDVLAMVAEDAEFLECQTQVDHARTILARGTSADRQLTVYWQERDRGGMRLRQS